VNGFHVEAQWYIITLGNKETLPVLDSKTRVTKEQVWLTSNIASAHCDDDQRLTAPHVTQ